MEKRRISWVERQNEQLKLAARDLSLATVLLQNLFENLDIQYSRFTETHEVVQANRIRNFKLKLQSEYQENPQHLAELIRALLQKEKQILSESQDTQAQSGQQVQLPMETAQQSKIEQRSNEAKEQVMSLDQKVKFLEEQQEIFDFRYKTYRMQSASRPTDSDLQRKGAEIQCHLNELDRKRREILDQVKQLLGLCETLLGFLQQELSDWLQRQRLSCIGASTNICLKQLETWVTRTVTVFFHLKRILRTLKELSTQVSYQGDPLKIDPPRLEERLREMLLCLLKRSFVVCKQPIMTCPWRRPLVLKTSTQFSVGARLLVNLPELRNNMKVSYKIDDNHPVNKGYRRFNVLGSEDKTLECMQGEGLAVEYKHLTLKEQRAGGKGSKGANDGSLSVIEELHVITLKTQFNHDGENLTIEAITLPFIVISNFTQFTRACASVLWFNLLSTNPEDVSFFCNPPDAPWILVADALSWQFSCCTNRGLNADQLQMLGKKLCGSVPNKDSVVPWSNFSKDPMSKVSFTFWEWFDAILALVKAHLENIWNDGYVMGFVSRSTEDALLRTMQQGTFLLRFSESERDGGITCSWVDHQPDGTYTIRSVEPYRKKELSHIPLTEIIRNYQLLAEENIPENPLKFLYPNIPKDEAFGQYYELRSEVNMEYQKYLKRKLIVVSERNVDDSLSSIASGTPQYFSETSQSDNDMFLLGQSEYPQNVSSLTDDINQMTMDNFFINPDSDPMLPDRPTISDELSLDSLNFY
ncbi:signal transducer and activator of transcription 2 isoform X2 [Phyllobates terribilis]|uniref:signal transducer and activator of transcription 2 isoform X2 n=1 Tax=Phyllobates terribilis TaxID=111132 RepID=UPI003CCAA295